MSIRRRTALALGVTPLAAFGLSGCATLQEMPGLQRLPMVRDTRSAFANALYWIRGLESATRTEAIWSRPGTVADLLRPDPSADVFAEGSPAHWMAALTVGDPRVLQPSGPFGPAGAEELAIVPRLAAPSSAITARQWGPGGQALETASWHDATDLLPPFAELLKDLYEPAEDDEDALVLRDDLDPLPAAPDQVAISARIETSGRRLVFEPVNPGKTEDGEKVEDPRTGERLHLGAAAQLVDMLTSAQMDGAHLVRGAIGGMGRIGAWLWASELRDEASHRTIGVYRPADGTAESAEQISRWLTAGGIAAGGVLVRRTDITATAEGVHQVVAHTELTDASRMQGWADLPEFYRAMDELPDTGFPMPEEATAA